MSRSYRRTPSIIESPKRKRKAKKIANRHCRRQIRNGLEISNGCMYKKILSDSFLFIDFVNANLIFSFNNYLDAIGYYTYKSEVIKYEEDLKFQNNHSEEDFSIDKLNYIDEIIFNCKPENIVYMWNNNEHIRHQYGKCFENFNNFMINQGREYRMERWFFLREYKRFHKKLIKPYWSLESIYRQYNSLCLRK